MTFAFEQDTLAQIARKRYQGFQLEGIGYPVAVSVGGTSFAPGRLSWVVNGASVSVQEQGAWLRNVHSEYALDSLARVLMSVLLLPRQGLLLHASTILDRGGAHVFMGQSGAGKSTVAGLSAPRQPLTDEISLLRFSEGSLWAYSTPFWGGFRSDGTNTKAPVAGIYALKQATEHALEPLSGTQAVRALLGNVLFFSKQPADKREVLQLAARIVQQAPVRRLRFRRDPGFWEVISHE